MSIDQAMSIDHLDRATDLISEHWVEVSEIDGLADLLNAYGVDLCATGAELPFIERGTPVFIRDDADAPSVLRRMAEAHVKFTFVLGSRGIVGVVDMVDLMERAAVAAWLPDDHRTPAAADEGRDENSLP